MDILISVIIPVYNVAPFVENCLKSVVNQNFENLEIIIVDDCGSDESMDIVRQFTSSHTGNFIFLKHEKNRGLSAARNTGVEHAKGDYVFFLDSDDELIENAIPTFVAYLQKYGGVDFLIGNYIVEGPFKYKPLLSSPILLEKSEILKSYLSGDWYVMACGKLINRDFFVRNSLWFEVGRLHEDELFSFHLALSASKMVIVQSAVYKYIIHSTGSITARKTKRNYADYLQMIILKFDLVKRNIPLDNQSAIYSYFLSSLYGFATYVLETDCLNIVDKKCMLAQVRSLKKDLTILSHKVSLSDVIKKVIVDFIYLIMFAISPIKTYADIFSKK